MVKRKALPADISDRALGYPRDYETRREWWRTGARAPVQSVVGLNPKVCTVGINIFINWEIH